MAEVINITSVVKLQKTMTSFLLALSLPGPSSHALAVTKQAGEAHIERSCGPPSAMASKELRASVQQLGKN